MYRVLILLLLAVSPLLIDRPASAQEGPLLKLELRTRVRPFKTSAETAPVRVARAFRQEQVALILCDVWDKHWCPTASERCDVIAKKLAKVVEVARARGVHIIHAPSDCMGFYKDAPQRQWWKNVKPIDPANVVTLDNPPLPIDDSDGGCDCPEPVKSYRAWTRQHPAIKIADRDVITDNGKEAYTYLKTKGIQLLLVAGVHTNMCVLHRTFAIKQMTKWGVPCALVRDLTDAMYNPKKSPFVTHDRGTELVVEYIEQHWCPSIHSSELLRTSEK